MTDKIDKEDETDKGAIAWFARNPVAANLLMLVLIVGGLGSLFTLKRETFPQADSHLITVTVPYPGAPPAEVEEGICTKIEEAVQGVAGIKKITSSASENAGAVTIEVLREYDIRSVLDDVKARVDGIDTFPEEAEEPLVAEVVMKRQSINVAICGDLHEVDLKRLGERVRDDLAAQPGITQVELTTVRPYEVSIEVSEHALRRWGLTFDQVANAVRRSSLDLPGGAIKASGGEILLRAKGQRYVGREFEDLVVFTRQDGTRVRLKEVADIIDGFEDTDQAAYFDGKRAVLIQVFRVGDQDVLKVVDEVKTYLARLRPQLPEGVEVTTWMDETKFLKGRIGLLTKNLVSGLVLVFLLLAIFLRLKLAFWVALGIPISFLGCVAFMPTLGVSVNMISLFAFIVVLGIVVDDAIVVGENIYTKRATIKDGVVAAIKGTKGVSVPVTFGVLTTMVAFAPMMNIPGNFREIWKHIALIVIFCLLFSLVESKLILPSHLAYMSPRDKKPRWFLTRAWAKLHGWTTGGLQWFIHKAYTPFLEMCLRARYVTLAAGVATLTMTIGLVAGGYVKFFYFPPIEGDNVVATLTMPQGTSVEVTQRVIRRLQEKAFELEDQLKKEGVGDTGEVFEHVLASIGDQPHTLMQNQNQGRIGATFSGGNRGEVNIQMVDPELRSISSDVVLQRWRALVGPVPGVEELAYTSSIFPTADDINIQLAQDDIGTLREAAEQLKAKLATYPGVESIADSFRVGKKEVKLKIKPAAETLGLTLQDLAKQVRQGFYGEEAQRIQRGRDDIKVMVRYTEEERHSLGSLEEMRIRTPEGSEVPFWTVAEAEYGRGYATIRRTDRARVINVTADVDEKKGNANEIVASLQATFLPRLASNHPGLRYSFEGDDREQRETMAALMQGFLIALCCIFGLMAVPFRSYIQ
ncbi:MAG: efflux RND transporter permease subunit, partial [Planctomycetota bacterium]